MNHLVTYKREGFSLIEVLIGLVFLAIGLLAIASLQVTSVRGNFFSNNLMQATYVAQDRLEFLQNLPLTDHRLREGSHDDQTYTPPGVPDLTFYRSYSVQRVSDPSGDFFRINYSVRWNDGTNHRITFSTIRSQ